MQDPAAAIAEFKRYASLLRPLLAATPGTFMPQVESATAVQVERGIVFPQVMRDSSTMAPTAPVERLIELASSERLGSLAVIDRAGHHRAMYRPLLVYAWLQAFRIVYETLPRSAFGRWEEGLRPWCDLLESELGALEWPPGPMPAALGANAAESVWTALALHVAGKVYIRDAWTDLASDTFGQLTRRQQPSGAFLHASSSDNPETHWYHELAVLHAAASYAVQTEDRKLAAAVARNATFHLSETQPDHATAQPWAAFAFIWNPPTRSLGDQILHTAQANDPQGADGVSLMLLADALYCVELFTK